MAVVEPITESVGSRRRLRLRSPATLAAVGEIDVQGADEVRVALERSRKAQPEWSGMSVRERANYLRRAVRVLLERQQEFLEVIVRETGKPETEVLGAEFLASCDALEFYAKHAPRVLADRRVPVHLARTKRLRISYRPLGVVGIITPWNFPFILSLNPTIQALVAGNAVLLKPSEVTPYSGRLVEELFRAAGLPEGVLQVLLGDRETGEALVESGVDKISFTGSVATGRKVAVACARQLLPCTLELGGNDPMIVCADADLERAARGAVYGAFANAGQVCISTERVYVVEEVADAFTERVLEEVGKLRQGADGEFDVGPMIWPSQLDVVDTHVRDALDKGARLLAGGRRNPRLEGLFYEPTVVTDVTHDMELMRRETFGPVLPIMRVRDEAEALRLANDTSYGLNANVWTRDRRRGVELAKQVISGAVVINDCMTSYGVTEAPFGGRRESGIGQVNGETGLRGFCHAQAILIDRFGSSSEYHWYPYRTRKARRLARLLRTIWGTPLGRWLS